MVAMMPACRYPCCWVSDALGGIAIVTAPGSTRSSVAPIVAITCCFAKLRRTLSGSKGGRSTTAPALHANVLVRDVGDQALRPRSVEVPVAQDATARLAHTALDQV